MLSIHCDNSKCYSDMYIRYVALLWVLSTPQAILATSLDKEIVSFG